jgi:hypothetical protein
MRDAMVAMFSVLLKAAGFRIDSVRVLAMGLACVEAHPLA